MKYSSVIPTNYDRYIYLDSDILFFGKITELFNDNKEFSIVEESQKMNELWFNYPYADKIDTNKFETINGLNAGTFSYKNISFLENVRNLFKPYLNNVPSDNACLEQQSFNYCLAKTVDFDLLKCFNLTNITQLAAQYRPILPEKKLYHFCEFSGEMVSKYYNMKKYYDAIKR